jgi:hypothetical protein
LCSFQVHDELIFEVRQSHLLQAAALLVLLLLPPTTPLQRCVPFRCMTSSSFVAPAAGSRAAAAVSQDAFGCVALIAGA